MVRAADAGRGVAEPARVLLDRVEPLLRVREAGRGVDRDDQRESRHEADRREIRRRVRDLLYIASWNTIAPLSPVRMV